MGVQCFDSTATTPQYIPQCSQETDEHPSVDKASLNCIDKASLDFLNILVLFKYITSFRPSSEIVIVGSGKFDEFSDRNSCRESVNSDIVTTVGNSD